VTTSSVRPVFRRDGAGIEDPLRAMHAFLKAPGRFDVSDPSRPASFGAVAGGLDGLPALPELLLGLVRADGDHEVVGQVSWQPRTQGRRRAAKARMPPFSARSRP
jgi:hypothetical protein